MKRLSGNISQLLCPATGALRAAILVAGAAWSGQAAAQSEQSPAAAEEPAADEIVVTAQKRSERLVDVPISISVVSGDSLAAVGGAGVRDLQALTPGLITTNNALNYTPAIRGVSSTGTSAGEEQAVGVYVDDAYAPANFSGFTNLLDIARIEVLKGPQGTLFGRNTTAARSASSPRTRQHGRPRSSRRTTAFATTRSA